MNTFSTRQVAKELGLGIATLTRYITAKKVPAPKITKVGDLRVRIWNEKDIQRVRKLLPKLKNGRKLRYKKKK
jgi:transposase